MERGPHSGRPHLGAGRTAFTNALGGRVAVLAATEPHTLPADDHAQLLLHRTVRFLEGRTPASRWSAAAPTLSRTSPTPTVSPP